MICNCVLETISKLIGGESPVKGCVKEPNGQGHQDSNRVGLVQEVQGRINPIIGIIGLKFMPILKFGHVKGRLTTCQSARSPQHVQLFEPPCPGQLFLAYERKRIM